MLLKSSIEGAFGVPSQSAQWSDSKAKRAINDANEAAEVAQNWKNYAHQLEHKLAETQRDLAAVMKDSLKSREMNKQYRGMVKEAINEKDQKIANFKALAVKLTEEVGELSKRNQEQADMAKITMQHDAVMTEAARNRQIVNAGMRAALNEALKALEESNPNHPLLNKDNRQKLFEEHARRFKEDLFKAIAENKDKKTSPDIFDMQEADVTNLDPIPVNVK